MTRRPSPPTQSSRHGTAALELAIGIPLLLVIVALSFALGSAGIAALTAATEARRQAWAARQARRSASPLDPSRLSAAADLTRETLFVPVPRLPPLPGIRGRVRAESRHAVPAAGAWDDRDLRLSESRPVWHPSRELLERVVRHVVPGL
jgi:hypothetical protein